MQGTDRLQSGRLDRIGDRDESGGLSIDRDEHRRLAFGAQGVDLFGKAVDAYAKLRHHGGIPERHLPALHGAADALARDRLEIGCRKKRRSTFRRAFDDRLGQRMLRASLERGGK